MNISKLSSCQCLHVIEINDESSSSSSSFELKFSDSESEIDNLESEWESQSLQLEFDEADINPSKTVDESPSLVSGNDSVGREISSATSDITEDVLFQVENKKDGSPSKNSNCIRACEGEKVPCEFLSFSNNNIEVETSFSKNFDDKKEEYCSSEESELELKSFKKMTKTHVQLFSSDDSSSDKGNFADLPYRKVKRHKRRCATRSQLLNEKKIIQKKLFEDLKQKRSRIIRSLIPFVDLSCTEPLKRSKSAKQKFLRNMEIFRVNLFPRCK